MPMPYTLTRGPLLTLVENALNPQNPAEEDRREVLLTELRQGTSLPDLVTAVQQPFADLAVPKAPLHQRLRDDWIGQGANGPPSEPTGYWVGYQGDVEGVLRQGLIRTLEVSMGVSHDAPPDTATRSWPVQVHWKCPNPWFEVWVSWRRHDDTPRGGQVDMLIATPPDKANRLTTRPQFPPAAADRAASALNPLPEPTDATDSQGMWLVAHEHHRLDVADERVVARGGRRLDIQTGRVNTGGLQPLPAGEWLVPTPSTMWVDEGEVITVEPPSHAGGADTRRNNLP
jgi:hypothetical protein